MGWTKVVWRGTCSKIQGEVSVQFDQVAQYCLRDSNQSPCTFKEFRLATAETFFLQDDIDKPLPVKIISKVLASDDQSVCGQKKFTYGLQGTAWITLVLDKDPSFLDFETIAVHFARVNKGQPEESIGVLNRDYHLVATSEITEGCKKEFGGKSLMAQVVIDNPDFLQNIQKADSVVARFDFKTKYKTATIAQAMKERVSKEEQDEAGASYSSAAGSDIVSKNDLNGKWLIIGGSAVTAVVVIGVVVVVAIAVYLNRRNKVYEEIRDK